MSRSQQIYLMRLWKQACDTQGWDANDASRRHGIYAQVLGVEKRFSEFSNSDFDRVKAEFLMLCDRIQGAIEVDHPEIGKARRYFFLIRKHPEAYWSKIAKDKFGSSILEELNMVQLQQLLITLTARVAKHPIAENQPF